MALFDCTCDATSGHARALTYTTAHGDFRTPMFMPVGTSATVKGDHAPTSCATSAAQVVLANTYHLCPCAPAPSSWPAAGGIHSLHGLRRPHAHRLRRLPESSALADTREARRRRRHASSSIYDGGEGPLDARRTTCASRSSSAPTSPCSSTSAPPYPATREFVARAVDLLQRLGAPAAWRPTTRLRPDALRHRPGRHAPRPAARKVGAPPARHRGGVPRRGRPPLRRLSASAATPWARSTTSCSRRSARWPGRCPDDRPRYLMGVGNPTTLVRAVREGVDLFDCVLPTRTARMGTAFSSAGAHGPAQRQVQARDFAPLDPACDLPHLPAPTARAYLRHLVKQRRDARRHPAVGAQPALPASTSCARAREAVLAGAYEEFYAAVDGKRRRGGLLGSDASFLHLTSANVIDHRRCHYPGAAVVTIRQNSDYNLLTSGYET